jgi:hypothetical protein
MSIDPLTFNQKLNYGLTIVCSPMNYKTISGRIRTFLVRSDPVPDLYGSIYGYGSSSGYGSNFVHGSVSEYGPGSEYSTGSKNGSGSDQDPVPDPDPSFQKSP